MINGTLKIVISLLAAVGIVVSAVWALDSRIDTTVERELLPIRADLTRVREMEKTLVRIEEWVKSIDKRIEEKKCTKRR